MKQIISTELIFPLNNIGLIFSEALNFNATKLCTSAESMTMSNTA